VHPENAANCGRFFFLVRRFCKLRSVVLKPRPCAAIGRRDCRSETRSPIVFFRKTNTSGPAALDHRARARACSGAVDLVIARFISGAQRQRDRNACRTPALGLISYALAPTFAKWLREVAGAHPGRSLLQVYGLGPLKICHYAVVVGNDRANGESCSVGKKRRLTDAA
jgi:hypothetical protein